MIEYKKLLPDQKEKKYHYLTNCVALGNMHRLHVAKDLQEMIGQAQEIAWKTFRTHVPIEEVHEIFPDYRYHGEYLAPDGRPAIGFHIKDDWAVHFYKSRFLGKTCYYIDHSSIEYIWTKQGA
jgi:hypothetical protein